MTATRCPIMLSDPEHGDVRPPGEHVAVPVSPPISIGTPIKVQR